MARHCYPKSGEPAPWRWRMIAPILSRIDHEPGLYAIYIWHQLVYIGQSVNLHLRFRRSGIYRSPRRADFLTPWGEFPVEAIHIKVAYSRKYGDWAMRELRLIRRLKPRFNTIKYVGKESSHA